MSLKFLQNKKILILGIGKEGTSMLSFLRDLFPAQKIGVADIVPLEKLPKNVQKLIKKDENIQLNLGRNYLKKINKYDFIIKSPGIPIEKISPFVKNNQKIISQTELFLNECQKKIIGITGTKGKSTTATLVYAILKKGGMKVRLVGNIEIPCISFLKYKDKVDFFVFEMSSHQLREVKKSPHIAVFLSFFQEHLDYYKSFENYFAAKKNIALYQADNDFFIYNNDNEHLKGLAKKLKSNLVAYGSKKNKQNRCVLKNNSIMFDNEKIISANEIPLLGNHNLLNVMAAVSVGRILKIDPLRIRKAIKEFKPLNHRLEYIGKFKNIDFFNDSIATIPESTISAMRSMKNINTLIAGGLNRGQDFKSLAQEIARQKIKNIILFPDTGKKILAELKNSGQKVPNYFFVTNMKEAIKIVFQKTEKGICLLSPAAASFNLFKNYKDRGNQFKKYVKYFKKINENRKKKK